MLYSLRNEKKKCSFYVGGKGGARCGVEEGAVAGARAKSGLLLVLFTSEHGMGLGHSALSVDPNARKPCAQNVDHRLQDYT